MDSTFCKHCGTSLPEDELTTAQEKLDTLIQTGFDLLKENKAAEAMVIAENAVAANPSSATASSLKGMCHEAQGDVAEALECYEHVVSLKPDSALDKIKVNQLRNMMVAKIHTEPAKPDRRGALLVAAAVTALVVVGSIGLVRAMNKPAVPLTTGDSKPAEMVPEVRGFDSQRPYSEAPVQNTSVQDPQPTPQFSAAPTGLPQHDPVPTYSGNRGLPPAGQDDSGDVGPYRPNPPGNTTTEPTNPPAPQRHGEDPVIVEPGQGHSTAPTTPPVADPGQIIISVHGKPTPGSSTNDGGSRQNGLQALGATARSNFQLGHWAEAARDYEQAISMGGGKAGNYQRLGDCYSHMGRSQEAISAFNNAADKYDAAGNTAGAESCRQAIKLLKGG